MTLCVNGRGLSPGRYNQVDRIAVADAMHRTMSSQRFRSAHAAVAPLLKASIAAAMLVMAAAPPLAAETTALARLLERGGCPGCQLQDADLVHADLRDADLHGARLQRANLSRARLDGANLRGADLRNASLQGASLRNADLHGARLDGTDLRQADLNGAGLDTGALARAHWDQAIGIERSVSLSHAELHNAGVNAARDGRYPAAEQLFNEAIRRQPLAAISWLARALCRGEQGQLILATSDFEHAAGLYEQAGELDTAAQIRQSAAGLRQAPVPQQTGNATGLEAINGAVAAFRLLAPIAARALLPLPF